MRFFTTCKRDSFLVVVCGSPAAQLPSMQLSDGQSNVAQIYPILALGLIALPREIQRRSSTVHLQRYRIRSAGLKAPKLSRWPVVLAGHFPHRCHPAALSVQANWRESTVVGETLIDSNLGRVNRNEFVLLLSVKNAKAVELLFFTK